MQPVAGYVYGQEVTEDTGVITTTEVSDTKQRYKIIKVGDSYYDHGQLIETSSIKEGDIVIIQKHSAEGDTPPKLYAKGYALFLFSRIMAKEVN